MANGKNDPDYKRNRQTANKADLILEADKVILEKLVKLSDDIKRTNERITALAKPAPAPAQNDMASKQISEVHDSLQGEINSIRQEIKFLSVQSESIFVAVQRQLEALTSALGGAPVMPVTAAAPRAEVDYDKLAEKIAQLLPVQESISPDYIACKVAEQIVVPEYAPVQSGQTEPSGDLRPAPSVPVDLQLDEDDLADRIAVRLGGVKPEDFDILVDDDGCESISKEIVANINYAELAAAIAEKLGPTLEYLADRGTDYDEVATRMGDKIKVAGINEDAIAEKAAAVLSEYLPEIDADDMADKIAAQLISVMPSAEAGGDDLSKKIADRLAEMQDGHDYDIVLDEEGLGQITGRVSEDIDNLTSERFDKIEREIAEIKAMLAAGVAVGVASAAPAAEESDADGESLVTVSDLVEEAGGQESYDSFDDLVGEEPEELPQEEEPEEESESRAAGGVDFENMMKYNRSFIARIIQGSDEQKQYYGSVKTALLSYAKVNSNVAWGAERFNKGRETIARFKIRGKTLCLYLALNPTDYPYSVYHQVDVSGNKSLHGTPMMVKIKSPRGVKKAIRLIDDMLEKRGAVKRNKVLERDYAAMYPYETIEELIEDGLVKDVNKNK